MYKHRRNLSQKCRENRQFADRGSSRPTKIEGNLNITSKRLTIPPGFLCLGIKSEIVRKNRSPVKIDSQEEYILKEDLYSLFNNNLDENIVKPRRSSRILKKNRDSQNFEELRASSYYSKIFGKAASPPSGLPPQKSSHKNDKPVKNNSKSIFKEINEQCVRVQKQNNFVFNYSAEHLSPVTADKEEAFESSSFCRQLLDEICIDIRDNTILLDSKIAVSETTKKINDILSGRVLPMEETPQDARSKTAETDENHDEMLQNFNYLPSRDWVFETPPRQNITLPKVKDCAIEPALICTSKKQSNIYQVNSNVNLDFSNYNNRQNMEVDGRYFSHMASFVEKTPLFSNFNQQELPMERATTDCSYFPCKAVQSEKKFDFKKPFSNMPDNPFLQTISTPTKTVQKISRISNLLKRKQDDFGGDEKLNFQFKKNLFKDTNNENLFNFHKDEPKLFDFSQYKRDD